MRSWALLGVALAVALPLAVAVPGQAGLRITSVDVAADTLEAEALTNVTLVGEADCTTVLARREPTSTAGVRMTIEWTADAMTIGGNAEHVLDPSSCGVAGTSLPITLTLSAAVQASADAMTPQVAHVSWRLPESPLDDTDPANASADFTLRALPRVVATAAFTMNTAQQGAQDVTFSGQVTNLGNVPVRVAGFAVSKAELDGRPVPGGLVTVVGPSALARGASAEVTAIVSAPLGSWSTSRVVGNLTVASTVEPGGEPRLIPFEFLLTNGGRAENKAPGLPLAGAWLGLALAVLVARRRRS